MRGVKYGSGALTDTQKESMNAGLQKLAEATCGIIKSQCGKDPSGAVCKNLVEKYR